METTPELASSAQFTRNDPLLRRAFHAIPDALFVVDVAGALREMNAAAEELCGWTRTRAEGRPLAEVFPVVEEPGGDEHTGRLGDRLLVWTVSPLTDPAGPVGDVVLCHDVTGRRREDEQRLRASRLEVVAELAGGIAHDFNNLLTGIMASVSVAQIQERRGQPVTDRLHAALLACERARSLTQQLLTFARGGEPVKRPVAVDRLVREAAKLALQGCGSHAHIEIPADTWPIDADPAQIGQVLHNLLRNADQAMPSGGTVRIDARNAHRGDRPYVAIAVADHGRGIPPEHQARIFDPFFTTKPRGSGLGLATVYSILLRHSGHIDVAARPGGGTLFTAWLPALPGASIPVVHSGEPALVGGTGRILVMDDEAGVLDAAGEALRMLGYEVACASDGQEAFERYGEALRAGKPYDAVIMDLTVPGGIGGTEAIRRIRAIHPEVRALVSSGYSNDPVLANPPGYGFQGVIAKPWRLQDLDLAVRRILRT